MSETRIALIRGINVGRAKRVAMADLRALFEELGCHNVRTLLNSGNVVFTATGSGTGDDAARLEAALASRLGVSAGVIVLTAGELAAVVAGNPLGDQARDPSRLLVAFFANPADRSRLEDLEGQDWSPEALSVGGRAAYLWCPEGILASRLAKAVGRVLGEAFTSRNWATVRKLAELVQHQG